MVENCQVVSMKSRIFDFGFITNVERLDTGFVFNIHGQGVFRVQSVQDKGLERASTFRGVCCKV